MDYEVLIVGGGPAGSSAAIFLSKVGITSCLIEKNFQFDKPCGGGIPSAGLKDLDLLAEVKKGLSFNIVKKIKIVPPFSSPIEVSFKGGELFIFERKEFDSFLRGLVKKSGTEMFEGELIKIEKGKNNIESTIKSKTGDIKKIYSKYVIAADGVNSRVCSLIGMKKIQYFWTLSFHMPKLDINPDSPCEFWFGSSHASFFYSWVFPGKDYFSVGTGAEKVTLLRGFIENFVKKRFPSISTLKNFNLRAYKIPRWSKRKFFKDNIIFCGDCLGSVMPVSFEGIYYGMKSGQFAAEAIKKKDLTLYEKLWDDRFGRQFYIMKKFQDYMFGNDERIDQWLNIHRDPNVQEIAMALWLRKEKGNHLIPLYFKAFGSFISRIFKKHISYS